MTHEEAMKALELIDAYVIRRLNRFTFISLEAKFERDPGETREHHDRLVQEASDALYYHLRSI